MSDVKKQLVGVLLGIATLAVVVWVATRLSPENAADLATGPRFCNTILPELDPGVTAYGDADFTEDPLHPGDPIVEAVSLYIQTDDSVVVLDPATGEVTRDLPDPADAARFDDLLSRKRVESIDPSTAVWPYGSQYGASPTIIDPIGESFTYREPEPRSGIILLSRNGDLSDPLVDALIITNCRSQMTVLISNYSDGRVEKSVRDDYVLDEDRTAFDRFASEVLIKQPVD